jgi:hypothetical protein
MLIAAALGGAGLGAIAGFLKGKFNINEIVVTMQSAGRRDLRPGGQEGHGSRQPH